MKDQQESSHMEKHVEASRGRGGNGLEGGIKVSKNFLIASAAIFAILVFAFFVGSYYLQSPVSAAKNSSGLDPNANIPSLPAVSGASFQLFELIDNNCKDCFDITQLSGAIKSLNLNISLEKKVQFDSEEGKQLVQKYGIENIPNLVVLGDIKSNPTLQQGLVQIGKVSSDAKSFVLTKMFPLYYNLTDKKYYGKIDAIVLKDSSCKDCPNYMKVIDSLKVQNVVFSSVKEVELKDSAALVEKYKIERVPTVIFSADAGYYDFLAQALATSGSKEADGSFVLRQTMPPFVNVSTEKVEGFVSMIRLVDSDCKGCYNVSMHEDLLKSYGMAISNRTTVEVSSPEGKILVAAYNITAVPTVILSKEVQLYPFFSQVWNQVGSVEADGNAVFRAVDILGNVTYFDLKQNKAVTLNATVAPSAAASGSVPLAQ